MAADVVVVTNWDDLGSLLSRETLEELAQTAWGPVIIRDYDRRVLWAPAGYDDPCGHINGLLGIECAACRQHVVQSTQCRIVECSPGIRKAEAPIRIGGRTWGFVSGPEQTTRRFGKRLLPRESKRTRRRKQPLRPETWQPLLDRVAGSIQIEVELARAEQIRLRTDRRLRDVATAGDAVEIVFDALRQLFGEIDIIFYWRHDTGVLRRWRVSGRHQALMPTEISDREGHVGWVVEHREPYYEPDLSNPRPHGPTFRQPRPSDPYLTAASFPVFIPNLRVRSMAVGVIQLCAFERDAFPQHLQPFAQAMISSANLHAAGARWAKAAADPRPAVKTLNSWREELIGILQDALRDRAKALDCKRRLCRAVTEHAWRISNSWNASLRWVSPEGGLRFIACAGDGWTETHKNETYRRDDGSTGMYVLATGQAAYIEDTHSLTIPYREIFRDTRSLIVFPIRERGEVVAVLTADSKDPEAFSSEVREAVAALCQEFEAALGALLVIEHGLIRSLEQTLILSGGVERFAFQASRLIGRLFETEACSIFTMQAGSMSLQGTTSEIRGYGNLEHVNEIGMELAYKVVTEQRLHRGLVRERPCLAVPIKIEDQIRAVICLIGREKTAGGFRAEEFSTEDETFMSQIAAWLRDMLATFFVVQEAEVLAKQAREEAQQAQRLLLAEGLDSLGQALSSLVLVETRAVGVHFRIPGKDGSLRLCGSAGLYREVLPETRPAGEGISTLVMRTGTPMWAPNVLQDPLWSAPLDWLKSRLKLDAHLWIQSACGLPMKVGDRVIGVLVVDWRDAQRFEPDQRQQIEDLAARCARLFHRLLREYETTDRLARQVKMLAELRQVAAEYAKTSDLDKLLEGILDTAKDKTGMQIGTIRLRNSETGKLVMHAPRNPLKGQLSVIDESEVTVRGMNCDHPLPITNLEVYPPWQTLLSDCNDPDQKTFLQGLGSMVQVPIRSDKPVGLIALFGKQPQEVDEDTLSLLTILASYAAVAIEFDQVKRQLEQVTPLAELTEMVADFLHVFTNHVNAIQTIVATIQDSDIATTQATSQMQKLRNRIRDLTKAWDSIQHASEAHGRERVDVNDCVRAVFADFDEAFSPIIKGELNLGEDAIVFGTRTHIESVIRHVVRNALEAIPEGGVVTVSTRRVVKTDSVIVEIQDTGPGMSPETRERCTRPFFTTKQGRGGSGLGLWISSQVLRRLGGKLEIESQMGKGTTVRILLPGSEQV